MNNTSEIQKSNSLVYNVSTFDTEGNALDITISLNDKCKNGHQDFSIVGTTYQKGKPKTEKNIVSFGCSHDEILIAKPEFKLFVKLSGCDYAGVPTHPSANGYYIMNEGFIDTKPSHPSFKTEYCELFRITESQFHLLKMAENEVQFALLLKNLGILKQWGKEAKKAIKVLEKLTECQFVNDSKRSQYIAPTAEEKAEEEKRKKDGYYTEVAKLQRVHEAEQKEFTKLKEELNKEIEKHIKEYEVKKEVLLKGGSKALDNCIFYNQTQELAFNWRSYQKLTEEELKFIDSLELPEGVTVTNKG